MANQIVKQVFGVENFGDRGLMIQVWIKTQPLKQWDGTGVSPSDQNHSDQPELLFLSRNKLSG